MLYLPWNTVEGLKTQARECLEQIEDRKADILSAWEDCRRPDNTGWTVPRADKKQQNIGFSCFRDKETLDHSTYDHRKYG